MKIYIKYMVSTRCKMTVLAELEKLRLQHGIVELGEINIKGKMSEGKREKLRIALLKSGLELMDDKKSILIEKVKTVIIEMIHLPNGMPNTNTSDYLSEKLEQSYPPLAAAFSEVTGTTIENFVIAHKIERVKELLLYDELTLTEISYQLNYSSVAHLSYQFKKITGLTPTYFKQLKEHKRRIVLENI